MEFIVTCAFGIEKLVKNEIKRMGLDVTEVRDGAITVDAPLSAVATLNLNLRCGERVYMKIASFKATTFDMLFDGIKQIEWQNYLNEDSAFPVDAKSQKSDLFSLSDIQSISKKAIVEKLKKNYKSIYFKETGAPIHIEIRLVKNSVSVLLETSGDALHKRGYRTKQGLAPLKETTAAALVLLSNWYGDYPLLDPMCGSGTLLIEAAMLKRNIAAGLGRKFAFESFSFIDSSYIKNARKAAYAAIDYDRSLTLIGSDINPKMITIAKENAENAGVDDCIEFSVNDVANIDLPQSYSKVICNPPYGERLSDSDSVLKLYQTLGSKLNTNASLSAFILTSNSDFERAFGRSADKNRKLYNGKIKCYYYQYYGERPPKKQEQ